ncbi:MAG TPA: hypothetical protein VGM56_02410, partial [Byssovorax sp.]
AAASRRLLDDDELTKRLGAAAAARAQREFERDVMVRRSMRLYDEAIHGSPRSAFHRPRVEAIPSEGARP